MKTDLEIFSPFAKKGKNIERVDGNNCIIYTRVSSKEQEEGYSLDTQLNSINAFKDQRKLNCIAYFGGKFESASKAERKEFDRMIQFARKSKDKISYILVAHTDRFDRRGANAIYIADTLRGESIRILSVNNPVDTFTPEGKFSQNIQFIVSEFDNDQRRLKCGNGMRDMLLDGFWPGRVPLGYDQKGHGDKQVITVNEIGKLLRKAFQWKAENKYNNLQIIEKLKSLGVTLKKSQISRMFSNPFYCGIISHNMLQGKVVEGKHEKLISKELFMQINEMGSKNPKGKMAKEFKYVPLKHFMKCHECGTPFSGYIVRKKNLWYYKCNKVGCKLNRSANELNKKFEGFLENFQIDPKYIAPLKDEFFRLAGIAQQENKANEVQFKTQLTELNKRIELTEEKFILNDITKEQYDKYSQKYKAEKSKILEEMEAMRLDLSNLEKSITKYCNLLMNLPSLWASGNYHQKAEIQNLMFPAGILYLRENDSYRTLKVSKPVLDLVHLAGGAKGEKCRTASITTDRSTLVARTGIEPVFRP